MFSLLTIQLLIIRRDVSMACIYRNPKTVCSSIFRCKPWYHLYLLMVKRFRINLSSDTPLPIALNDEAMLCNKFIGKI